jgi:hypothetical protein
MRLLASLFLAAAGVCPARAQYGGPSGQTRSSWPSQRGEASDSGGDLRISKDFLLGAAVYAVPGGGFLSWTDPKIDNPWVNSGTGLLLGVTCAIFGIKAYVDGDIGMGLGIHAGSILLGYAGHEYAATSQAVRYSQAPQPRGPTVAATYRF